MDDILLLALFFTGLTAGAEAGFYWFLRPVKRKLEPAALIRFEQELEKVLGKIMPVLMIASLIAAWAYGISQWDAEGMLRSLGITAAVAFTLATVVTVANMVPINVKTLKWNPEKPPANWQKLRHKWELYQGVRTYLMVLGFALICVSAAVAISLR